MNFRISVFFILCLVLSACGTPATTTPALTSTGSPMQTTAATAVNGTQVTLLRTSLQTLATTATTQIVAAATTGDKAQVKQASDAFETTWSTIEDQVKATSNDSYHGIEQAMSDLQDVAVRADRIDVSAVQAKGAALTKAINDFTRTLK